MLFLHNLYKGKKNKKQYGTMYILIAMHNKHLQMGIKTV